MIALVPVFIQVDFFDILDIFLVAYLLYRAYMLIKGTVAINIFVGIFSVYLLWIVVKALNMQLLSSILGQVTGVGVIALIIVFQQEVRRFLLLIGTRYFSKNNKFLFERLFSFHLRTKETLNIKSLVLACKNMSQKKIGALIVIAKKTDIGGYSQIGDALNASISSRLLETIFFKNTPLHDGAVIIVDNKIKSARCVLPVSDNPNFPPSLGMRHRAALGMSEASDSVVLIVSEQTGNISYAQHGELFTNITPDQLNEVLLREFNL